MAAERRSTYPEVIMQNKKALFIVPILNLLTLAMLLKFGLQALIFASIPVLLYHLLLDWKQACLADITLGLTAGPLVLAICYFDCLRLPPELLGLFFWSAILTTLGAATSRGTKELVSPAETV